MFRDIKNRCGFCKIRTDCALHIALQTDLFGDLAHAEDALVDHVVQGHVYHFAALFDDAAVDAGGEILGLILFLHALELQIHDAL